LSIEAFIHALQESGHVVVAPDVPSDRAAAEASLRALDAQCRQDLPHEAPALSMPAALWAAGMMYRACQFLAYREIEPAVIQKDLADPCPEPLSPAVCYSVDLTMRVLPEVLALARGLSDDDPLIIELTKLAQGWPLSSVGIAKVGDVQIDAFIDDPCLRQLYVDRSIQRGDVSRLNDPRVASAAREALGAYHDLAPSIAKALGFGEDDRHASA